MKTVLPEIVEKARIRNGDMGSSTGDRFGLFRMKFVHREGLTSREDTVAYLTVIACSAEAAELDGRTQAPHWDHVSVSCQGRPPMWAEMEFVRRLFFEPDECVVQFHPPLKDYININTNVLHMWRCPSIPFPMPPKECV